jgi:hypothetical protein
VIDMAEVSASPSPESKPSASRPRRRRWPWIVLALIVLAFLLRGPLLAPVVVHLASQYLGQAIGGQATVAAAGGGWFSDARLSGIVASAPLGTVRALNVGEIRATYGIGILRGDLAAVRSLHIRGVNLELDLRSAGGDGALPPLLDWLPRPLPLVDLQGDLLLHLPQGEVHLRNLRLQIVGDQVALEMNAQVGEVAPVQVSARFARTASDTLRLDQAVTIGDATLETLSLVLGRERQQLQATVGLGGGRGELNADPARVTLSASGLDLAAIPAPLRALLPVDPGVVHGTLALDASAIRAASGWNIAGSVRAADVRCAGVGPFTLSAQGHLGAGQILVPLVALSGPGGGTLRIADLVLDLTTRRPTAGVITADITNVANWLPEPVPRLPTPLALRATMVVDGDVVAIRAADLTAAGVSASVRGSIAARPWRIEAADILAQADLATVASLIPGAPNLAGSLQARLGGTVPLTNDLTQLLAQPLRLNARGDGLTMGAVGIDALRIEAATHEGRVVVEHAVAQISAPALGISGSSRLGVDVRGSMARTDQAWDGNIDQLSITFPGTTVTNREAFPVLVAHDRWSTGVMRLTSSAGDLTAELRHAHGLGFVRVSAPSLDLDRLGLAGITGMAEVGIDLSGAWNRPVGEVRVQTRDLQVEHREFQVALHVTQDQHGLAVRSGRIAAGTAGTLSLSGTLPIIVGTDGLAVVPDDGRPAELVLDLPALERWLPDLIDTGAVAMHLAIGNANDPAALDGTVTFRGVRPKPTNRQGWGRSVPQAELDGTFAVVADGEGIRVTVAGSADGRPVIRGEVRSDGGWDPVGLLSTWRDRPVAGQLVLDGADLSRFIAAIPGLLHLAGRAEGTVTLAGTLAAPTTTGALTLSAVEAKFAPMVPTMIDGRVRVELDAGRLRLVDGQADLGGATVAVSGTVDLTGEQRIDVRAEGSGVLLVQRHDARVRADLALHLSGTPGALSLGGSAMVTTALFSPDLTLLGLGTGGTRGDGRLVAFEFTEPPLSTLRFDIAVSSRHQHRQDGVRLATNLVRADCDLALRLRGSGAAPELAGRVTVRDGLVALPFSTLRLSTGVIVFPEGDPFHPRLNATATAQVRRWNVTLQVDGPLSDPQVRASANGLDQRDAMLLLTTGSISAELGEEEGQYAVATRIGTWLGREAWNLIDGDVDPDAGPSVFERLTLDIGRDVSSEGRDTIEAQVEITDPELVPGVLLYGERDRWDDYNAGIILRFRWGSEP